VNILRLKAVSSRLNNGNPNRRIPGPPCWGLECGADTPTSVKTFPIEKPKATSQPDLRIQNHNGSWKRKNDWNLATWNVRSLFRAGALRNLTQELNRFNVMLAAIHETRQQVSDIFNIGDYNLQQW
jgi:hypothetical protein